jgi:hypothetical protein
MAGDAYRQPLVQGAQGFAAYRWWASPANEERLFGGSRNPDGSFYLYRDSRTYSRRAMRAARWYWIGMMLWWVLVSIPIAVLLVLVVGDFVRGLIQTGALPWILAMSAPFYAWVLFRASKEGKART